MHFFYLSIHRTTNKSSQSLHFAFLSYFLWCVCVCGGEEYQSPLLRLHSKITSAILTCSISWPTRGFTVISVFIESQRLHICIVFSGCTPRTVISNWYIPPPSYSEILIKSVLRRPTRRNVSVMYYVPLELSRSNVDKLKEHLLRSEGVQRVGNFKSGGPQFPESPS